jgi:murein DD-endopeptidase MepM/ murein hydrolase activator NlpD
VLGNHVVIRGDSGVCVLVAHLQRGSIEVARGQLVQRGDVVGRCGNSGNSTEPHVHMQVMDKASVWIAAGLPFCFDGAPPPRNGDLLSEARVD